MDLPPDLKERVEQLKIAEGERMLECRCRNRSGCTLINARLGWWHGMPLEDCDVCWALGGEKSPDASQFREKYTAGILGSYCRQSLEDPDKPDREVLVALTVLHKMIPESRFAEPDIQNAVKARVRWVRVKATWEKAASLLKSLGSKAPWLGKVSTHNRELREVGCFGTKLDGTRVGPPCQMLRDNGEIYYCGACGCGATEVAKLRDVGGGGGRSKLDFPYLECPLKKKGFSNARDL